jgi:hypothetical protein
MKCKRCWAEFSVVTSAAVCPVCGATSGGDFDLQFQPVSERPVADLIPFEDPAYDTKPLLALIETIRECILHPKQFFAKITSQKSRLRPLIFGLAVGGTGFVASFIWNLILPNPFGQFAESAFTESLAETSSVSSLITAPVILFFSILLLSLYFQAVLKIFKKSRASFVMMFRIICYSEAASLFMVFPFIGDLLSVVFGIYLTLTGIKAVHSISRIRAILMFCAAPVLLVILLFFMVLLILILAGTFAGSTLKDILPLLQ